MIKNKDGSYNKFKLLIISLICIITISMLGFYISENIEIPKIETPSWITPTPTPIPTSVSTPIPIDPKIALLYNSSNVTYNSNTTWNWSYTNLSTNVSNWTYPPDMIGNYTFVAAGGSGGSGGSGSYVNVSYAIVAGGGGGGAGYTSMVNINSTPAPQTTQMIDSQKIFVNASQNVSQTLIQIMNPLGESSWLVYLIIIIPMVMMASMIRGKTISMLLPAIIGMVAFGYFFNIGSMPLLAIIGIIPMIIIMSSIFSDR
jgi:hypothetical protein